MGVLLGGLLPALCFGTSNVLMKVAARAGVGPGPYVLSLALGVALYGVFAAWTQPERLATVPGIVVSILVGAVWALGMALIQVALTRYQAAISQITPLHMLNIVVPISLGFVLFAESRDLDPTRLVIGAILIAAGAVLVAGA